MYGLAAPQYRNSKKQPAQSKWGNVARAVGNGLMQMGQLNQQEKILQAREANLERLRQENRADKEADTKSSQAFQQERDSTQREFTAEENNKNRAHRVELDNKAISSREGIASAKNVNSLEITDRNNNTRVELAKSGGKGSATNSKIQLIQFYESMGLSKSEAIDKANQLNGKDKGAVFAQFFSDLLRLDSLGAEEAKRQAEELSKDYFKYKKDGYSDITETDKGNDTEVADYISKVLGEDR